MQNTEKGIEKTNVLFNLGVGQSGQLERNVKKREGGQSPQWRGLETKLQQQPEVIKNKSSSGKILRVSTDKKGQNIRSMLLPNQIDQNL